MNKNRLLFIICAIAATVIFFALVVYGWRHRYGAPITELPDPPPVVRVARSVELPELSPEGVSDAAWANAPESVIELHHQVTELPWSLALVPEVVVQGMRNDDQLIVRMKWEDDYPSTKTEPNVYPDAAGIGFPLEDDPPAEAIMMGFHSPMNIWHWRADLNAAYWYDQLTVPEAYVDHHYPFEEEEVFPIIMTDLTGAVEDSVAGGAGTIMRKDNQPVRGYGEWRDGVWRVVFKRDLRTNNPDEEAQFDGNRIMSAVSIWNGEKGDRGGRKSVSDWIILDLSPDGASLSPADASASLIASGRLNFGFAGAGAVAEGEENHKEFHIRARRFEYEPNRITVQKGDLVTFRLESLDVAHGLYLDGYEVDIRVLPGRTASATFRADQVGRYTFRCSITCGDFHPYMIGFLTVEPNRRFHAYFIAVVIVAIAGIGMVYIRRS